MADYLTTAQVAKLAGCKVRVVISAIVRGNIVAKKVERERITTRHDKRPGQMQWQIDVKSGREWAARYHPQGRLR